MNNVRPYHIQTLGVGGKPTPFLYIGGVSMSKYGPKNGIKYTSAEIDEILRETKDILEREKKSKEKKVDIDKIVQETKEILERERKAEQNKNPFYKK